MTSQVLCSPRQQILIASTGLYGTASLVPRLPHEGLGYCSENVMVLVLSNSVGVSKTCASEQETLIRNVSTILW